MLEFYGDVIVMRHFQQGAPHEAAKWASIPIINGGDGWGEHPTQILTDLYTVLREKGTIDGLRWLAVGDMRMRTMHSLGYALTQFDCPITFVAPPANALFDNSPDMQMPESYKADFRQYALDFSEAEHVEQAIADADVILVEPVMQPDYTKARDERKGDAGFTPYNYKITRELMTKKAKSDAILLHSLPRMDEFPTDVDITRWSRYWQKPSMACDADGVAGAGVGDGVIFFCFCARLCRAQKQPASFWRKRADDASAVKWGLRDDFEPFQASVEEAVRRYALEKAHARLWELEQTIQRWEDKYGCGYDLFAYRTATDAAYVAQLELIQKRRNGRAMLSPGNSIRLVLREWRHRLQQLLTL
jgi:aspartate carbamoyltransferase catalytic subunit